MSEVSARPRRRAALWVGLAAAVLIAVVVAVLLNRTPAATGPTATTSSSGAGSSESPAAASGGPTGATATRSPTPVPTASVPAATATGSPTVVPTKAGQTNKVPLEDKAEVGRNVLVKVTKFESVKGKAEGPGEIAGPALRITVSVTNGSSEEIPMDNALVNLYYGKKQTPASILSGPGAKPLSKPVRAGGSASGRYVFNVPADQQGQLSVEFSYTTDEPTVVFSGSR